MPTADLGDVRPIGRSTDDQHGRSSTTARLRLPQLHEWPVNLQRKLTSLQPQRMVLQPFHQVITTPTTFDTVRATAATCGACIATDQCWSPQSEGTRRFQAVPASVRLGGMRSSGCSPTYATHCRSGRRKHKSLCRGECYAFLKVETDSGFGTPIAMSLDQSKSKPSDSTVCV